MTFRTLIKQACRVEGKKKQIDIAQMSEAGKVILTILANIDLLEVDELLQHYKFQRRSR